MADSISAWLALAMVMGASTTLMLSGFRWFRRPSYTDRLAAYASGCQAPDGKAFTFRWDLLIPHQVIRRATSFARVGGVGEPLKSQLIRAGYSVAPSQFRQRQLSHCAIASAIALVGVNVVHQEIWLAAFFITAAPLLVFLAHIQKLQADVRKRSDQLFRELPVLSEQLATLLNAGFSPGAALNRLSLRQNGVAGHDIARVCDRVRLGLGLNEALREWSEMARVPELTRLIAILEASAESSDAAKLVSQEAVNIRRESQRRLLETIDRRGQQVWIPVTIATLLPGVIFMLIPFLHALNMFSSN